ncbi:unnamed protein product, partial [marine sediment metagenome]
LHGGRARRVRSAEGPPACAGEPHADRDLRAPGGSAPLKAQACAPPSAKATESSALRSSEGAKEGARAECAAAGGEPPQEAEALEQLKAGAGSRFDPHYVRLFVDERCCAIEQRRFPRIEYRTPVEVRVLGPDGSEVRRFETEALDLSEGGILLRSEEPLEPHTPVRLVIDLPSEKIEAIAKVVRVLPGDGPGRRIGAYFIWYGPADS